MYAKVAAFIHQYKSESLVLERLAWRICERFWRFVMVAASHLEMISMS